MSRSRVHRRDFLALGSICSVAAAWPTLSSSQLARAEALLEGRTSAAENAVEQLYASLTPPQRQQVCFSWDHQDPQRGLLRTFVSNNWQITDPEVQGDFYTSEQQALIRQIFEGITQPEWHAKFDKQLTDDAGGWGHEQSIAIFGVPGTPHFEFVLTGRHMTVRCDGNSADHVAFGGPIFYGHDAQGTFNEAPDHPGNVFWPQAQGANRVFGMLDSKQRQSALVAKSPEEKKVPFQGPSGMFPGLAVREMSADQKGELQKVLALLVEPYRASDRDEVATCLAAQGGLDACSLAFYQDPDVGADGVWDNWRLEGPAFVWYFRGAPHVHVWVHIADDPSVALNA